ncbi:hypothetical protein PRIPAC_89345, partial [Pristionchus pacificus]|uniref:Uncharacterized protein n=1 Tax=Pristionchus pacificus TaxID=54126 RepID=A0A2A6B672_PRIPA
NYEGGDSLVSIDVETPYLCNPSTGRLRALRSLRTKVSGKVPFKHDCLPFKKTADNIYCDQHKIIIECGFSTNGASYVVQEKDVKCPAGKIFEVTGVGYVLSMQCSGSVTEATLLNNTITSLTDLPEAKCVPVYHNLNFNSKTHPAHNVNHNWETNLNFHINLKSNIYSVDYTVHDCSLPPVPAPGSFTWPIRNFTVSYLFDGRIQYTCAKRPVGNQGSPTGPIVAELASTYTCDPADGK